MPAAVANRPSAHAALAGMSAASAARSNSSPADVTTSTNSIIAPSAAAIETAPLIQSSAASGGTATSDATGVLSNAQRSWLGRIVE